MNNNYINFLNQFHTFFNNHKSYQEPIDLSIDYIKNNQQITNGLCLEFGVYEGHSISKINSRLNDWSIHGFDSFQGLPEKWRDGFDKNHFKLDKIPLLDKNIILHVGYFNDTIPKWKDIMIDKQIHLLHVDCDLYSSTKTIFDMLHSFIKENTIIVFDEFINYPGYENHEALAFYEFINDYNKNFKILFGGGYNLEKVSVVIV
jgi:hypothetical protein